MMWLIWSNEHVAFWKLAERGYTTDISEAGRYDEESAARIVRDANEFVKDGDRPNEIMCQAPESVRAERLEAAKRGEWSGHALYLLEEASRNLRNMSYHGASKDTKAMAMSRLADTIESVRQMKPGDLIE